MSLIFPRCRPPYCKPNRFIDEFWGMFQTRSSYHCGNILYNKDRLFRQLLSKVADTGFLNARTFPWFSSMYSFSMVFGFWYKVCFLSIKSFWTAATGGYRELAPSHPPIRLFVTCWSCWKLLLYIESCPTPSSSLPVWVSRKLILPVLRICWSCWKATTCV